MGSTISSEPPVATVHHSSLPHINVAGTIWNWKNWANVELRRDGVFWAPDCREGQGGTWKQDENTVYITWGNAGLHTCKIIEGPILVGERFDGDPCQARFVRKIPEL